MKRLLTSRILACLIFLTIWGSKTYAQGSISGYTAGTENFKITSNTKIKSQSTEYQYYASANISLFIGAKEVWKEPKLIGDSYYLSSKGNPGIKPNDNAGKQIDAEFKGSQNCIALPNTGNYFHFLFHTKGKIILAFNVNYANPGNKYLYVEKATNETVTIVDNGKNYATTKGITTANTKASSTTTGITITDLQSGDNRYFQVNAPAGDNSLVIEIDAEAGEEYYIWMPSAENFALGGFTFEVDDSQRFTPWKPVVHRQIEFGKSPANMKNADGNAPSGVENITFMYGVAGPIILTL